MNDFAVLQATRSVIMSHFKNPVLQKCQTFLSSFRFKTVWVLSQIQANIVQVKNR